MSSAGVSITAPQFTGRWADIARAADTAEALGFSGIFLFDHLVPLGSPDRPVVEMVSALGALAAATSTLKVGTLVMRVPLRGEQLSGRVAATASALAPGRFILGVGAGDKLSRDEAIRFGLTVGTLEDRVASVDSLIRDVAAAQPSIPIWVGGSHPAVLDVVRRRGTGWNGWAVPPELFGQIAATVPGPATWGGPVVIGRDRAEAAALAGDRSAIIGDPAHVAAKLDEYLAAGAEELVVSIIPNRPERWRLFADEVIPRLGERLVGDR